MRPKLFCSFLLFFCCMGIYAQDNVYDIARGGSADDIIKIIKKYPKVINFKNKNGHTPLILACYSGNEEVVKVLVKHVENIDAMSNEGTALMASTFKGNIEISKILLGQGADVDAADLNDNTALHHAVRFNNIDIIKLLLAYDADINRENIEGFTPLDYAINSNNKKILKLLNTK